ncbi:MAG: hypothetical protein KAI64_07625 [Thermoplasmata archaeon]|nr:hypothetical protein [Thermoplasmata archaeon]
MKRDLGDFGAALLIIGIVLAAIGLILNLYPVTKTQTIYIAGEPKEIAYLDFPYATEGAIIFAPGLILLTIGWILVVKSKNDLKRSLSSKHIGQKYSERMPDPYFEAI